MPDELPEQMIEELRECDDPAYEMHCAIGDLECLLRDLKVLDREFSSLIELTRTESPDEEKLDKRTFDQAFREWNSNPKYVLPEVKDVHKTLRDAHAAITKLSKEGVFA